MRIDAGYENWLLLCDLHGGHKIDLNSEPFTTPPSGKNWQQVLSTNESRFGGHEAPPTSPHTLISRSPARFSSTLSNDDQPFHPDRYLSITVP